MLKYLSQTLLLALLFRTGFKFVASQKFIVRCDGARGRLKLGLNASWPEIYPRCSLQVAVYECLRSRTPLKLKYFLVSDLHFAVHLALTLLPLAHYEAYFRLPLASILR
jgi:hypothetical protein